MRTALVFTVFICCAASMVANSITSASSSPGSAFSAISVSDSESGGQLANSIAKATFADGSQASCVFNASGSCAGAGFTLNAPGSQTNSGAWAIFNTNASGSSMTSLTVNVGASNSAFNPCFSGGIVSISAGYCFGSPNGGGSALSVSSGPASGSAATASVSYTNMVILAGKPSNELFTQIALNFSGSFVNNGYFLFTADTDRLTTGSVTPLALDVPLVSNPEPATMGLVGFALVGLAFLQRHRKRTE